MRVVCKRARARVCVREKTDEDEGTRMKRKEGGGLRSEETGRRFKRTSKTIKTK